MSMRNTLFLKQLTKLRPWSGSTTVLSGLQLLHQFCTMMFPTLSMSYRAFSQSLQQLQTTCLPISQSCLKMHMQISYPAVHIITCSKCLICLIQMLPQLHKYNSHRNVKQIQCLTVGGHGKFAHVRSVPSHIVLDLQIEHSARMLARTAERWTVMGATVITLKKTVRVDGTFTIQRKRLDHPNISQCLFVIVSLSLYY
jgi:hypothetical protein